MLRKIKHIKQAQPTLEGAGVKLKRAFGYYELSDYDPFLLMDDFRNDSPQDYLAGFPWHPHRGIETITYMLEGSAEHGDSMGNSGVIHKGEVQWMTAGSGIIHQEMPKPDANGKMYGFQLWSNLPAKYKMSEPRYQDLRADEIPTVSTDKGSKVRIISGEFLGAKGPVRDIYAQPSYWDLNMPGDTEETLPAPKGYTTIIYAYEGKAWIDSKEISNTQVVLFEDGDEVLIKSAAEGFKFLYLMGKPLNEPIAWHGPIVMNTKEEIKQALQELKDGTFIKK